MDDDVKSKIAKYSLIAFICLIIFLIFLSVIRPSNKEENVSTSTIILLNAGERYSTNYNGYSWTSTDSSVAIVNKNGEIEGLKSGNAVITIQKENKDVIYEIKVSNVESSVVLKNVKMDKNTIELDVNEIYTMPVKIIPSNATSSTLSWFSSNDKVVSVDNGVIKGIAPGNAMVTVKSSNGYLDTCLVKVKGDIALPTGDYEKISFDISDIVLKKGVVYTINYDTVPKYVNGAINWDSSNNNVAVVNNGIVQAVGIGTAIITASSGEVKDELYITVVEDEIKEDDNPYLDPNKGIEITSIIINQEEISMNVDDSYQLVALILPTNASYEDVKWRSSNDSIVSVNENGNVRALSSGETSIIAETSNGLLAECWVTVNEKKVEIVEEKISLNLSSASLNVGDTIQLIENITPNNAISSVNWKSSNPSVASVYNGLVTAKSKGTALITATLPNGNKALTTINVSSQKSIINVITMSMNISQVRLKIGGSTQLSVKIIPNNATNKSVTWSSNNPSIVSVDNNGKVTAKSSGSAIITAKSSNGIVARASVIVEPNISIKLSESYFEMSTNTSKYISASVINSSVNNIYWYSSNSNVVTVDKNGKVTAKKEGTATIYATISGKSASCVIKVTNPVVPYNPPPTPVQPVTDLYGLEIHMINVGDGDAILIRSSTQTLLLDVGYDRTASKVINYLKDLGVSKIDAFMPSHFDDDHIGGLPEIANNFSISKVYVQTSNLSKTTEAFLNPVKSRGTYIKAGDVINFNEFSIKILGPIRVKDKCINGIFCGNTDSINFILTYKNTKYFFTGDYVQSDKILSNYNRSELSNVDFIKQPHHGLHDYISQDLISIMRPKIIFVPNGREHMSSTMRSWYSSVGAKIYNTYSEENLVAVSDGNNIKVYTNASATSFRR